MKKISSPWVIHIFAALHALGTIACTLLGFRDSLILTALTMAMSLIICYKESLTVEITIASVVLSNALGFLLGNVAALFVFDSLPPVWQHSVSTAIVTELLGWGLFGFANIFPKERSAAYEREMSWENHRTLLITAMAIIFGLRFFLADSYKGNIFKDSFIVAVVIVVTLLAFIYMVTIAIRMQREVSSQRTRRHAAEFRYMTLKHQVNPHFLFNCLNALDSIVEEGSREEASAFIHKLASIYRYLLIKEGESLVPVADELHFAHNYRELMEIRFPEGVVFEDNGIPANPPEGYVVPCTIQLLMENALKHNAFSLEKPLKLELRYENGCLSVTNNLNPKTFTKASTGIGLQYIRNQYRDLAGAEIKVEKTDNQFKVTLPILPNPNVLLNLHSHNNTGNAYESPHTGR